MPPQHYQDIDWNMLWQQAQAEKSSRTKDALAWDERAPSFSQRTERSPYTQAFLAKLVTAPDWTVLDIGCGPGTLALPLATRVKKITCIDFSREMLKILTDRAKRQCLANIKTYLISWTDDWRQHGIAPHDLVIASRSLAVPNLDAALRRLSEFAIHQVVITDRVGSTPHDPDAFAAIGRDLNTGPDYIFTINLLYQMGYLATVDFIRLKDTERYHSTEEALNRYLWMFQNLTAQETERLRGYIQSISQQHADGTISLHPRHVPTWAYISWHPNLSPEMKEGHRT